MVFIDEKYEDIAKAREMLLVYSRRIHEACDAKQMPKIAENGCMVFEDLADLDDILDSVDDDDGSYPTVENYLKFLSYLPENN